MLKLLARLFDPSEGQIFIDDKPLARYDTDQLRAAISFLPQSPVIYPLTARENICTGPFQKRIKDGDLEEAVRRGACSQLIARLAHGYETQLQPSFDTSGGWSEGTYGILTEGLKAELARHTPTKASLSSGERQRLAA
ncbi:hypothetical protein ID866_10243 [Astraeus odoratus]|nr:hypothetical protein ID866_10243 [Astraeus odoratus]